MDVLRTLLGEHQVILAEGAILERLRRHPEVKLDPNVSHAGLVTESSGRGILEGLYRSYLDIGSDLGLPMVVLTPTWRASRERLANARLTMDINRVATEFVLGLRKSYGDYGRLVAIGGLMGCRADAYHPATALPTDAAYEYHRPQAEALAFAGVDFLMGATLPAVSEAQGMAKAMAECGLPYILSFVVRPEGHVLDGTLLAAAIRKVDENAKPRPLGFMVNCVHPENFRQAVVHMESRPEVRRQLIGIQANTSREGLTQCDGSTVTETEDPTTFGRDMAGLHHDFHLRILGGCCGTDERHIRAVAENLKPAASESKHSNKN